MSNAINGTAAQRKIHAAARTTVEMVAADPNLSTVQALTIATRRMSKANYEAVKALVVRHEAAMKQAA